MVKQPTAMELEQRALRLLEDALDLDGARLDAFLDEHCAGDAGLRARVLALHGTARARGALTDHGLTPQLEDLRTAPEPEAAPGTRFGGFRVLRFVGRGGAGLVYEAEQEHPRRRVALKTLQLGTDGARRRFASEAELLARLRHPGIAQVYDAGIEALAEKGGASRSVPWMALEFVEEARSITDFARERGASPRELAALVARVCDAVQHGHQRGIVHRDLKPANLLVDVEGVPKVIDFGVARVVEDRAAAGPQRTHAGDLVGTPEYMAPEQFGGDPLDVDTRSDVWALGVVLYELCAGRRPFASEGVGWMDLARLVTTTPAPPLRRYAAHVHADLEAIVGRCLELEPESRYPTAAALGADLRRWLAHEPVEARAQTAGYRAARFVRRNRGKVATAVVVVGLLAASTWSSLRSARVAQRAEASERAERLAKEAFADDMQALATEVMLGYVQQLSELEGSTELRLQMTEETVARLDDMVRRRPENPTTREDLARAYIKLADLQGNMRSANLGDPHGALETLGKADTLIQGLTADGHGSEMLDALRVSALTRRGDLARTLADTATGLEAFTQLAEHYAARRAAAPDDEAAWEGEADAWDSCGRLLGFEGRHEEAGAQLDRATRLLEEAGERFPGNDWSDWMLTSCLSARSAVTRVGGDVAGALEILERVQAIDAALMRRDPDNADLQLNVAQTGYNLCETLTELGRFDDALMAADESLATIARLMETDAGNRRVVLSDAAMHYQRGLALLGMARAETEDLEGRAALALDAQDAFARSRSRAEQMGASSSQSVEKLHRDLDASLEEADRFVREAEEAGG